MYEDRKTKKRGVLESRETKYKTLMLRDADGKSFNITYSTFKSNWRKYQGEEVIETSTQIEEKKAEEKKKEQTAKKVVESQTAKTKKISTEEKVKVVRALNDIIDARIKAKNSELKTSRNTRGGIIVRFKKFTVFESWPKYNLDKVDIFFRDVVADTMDAKSFKALASGVEYIEHEKWPLRHGYRASYSELDVLLDKLIDACDAFGKTKEDKKKIKEDK